MTRIASRAVRAALLAATVTVAAACAPAPHPASSARASTVPASTVPAGSATSIPSSLLSQARPIGLGPRFHPAATGPVSGSCTRSLGPRDGVHVEVFAADQVLLLPAGLGTRPPRQLLDGRVTGAACYGALVTLDPTGVVLVRRPVPAGAGLTLGALFRSWGQPLSATRLASFAAPAGARVSVYVNGRRWPGAPGAVPLTRHAEIVLEVGPPVPPHASYAFPAGT
jgi:hypothetical protein